MSELAHSSEAPRILIAEDDILLANLWDVAFKQAGFIVTIVHIGYAAIEYLRANPLPAVVVVDHMMPFAEGDEVLDTLYELDPDRTVFSVFTSAVPSAINTVVRGKAHAFLEKPVPFSEIVAMARDLRDQLVDERA
ncbi:MAG: response regulator [Chloroflexota bacterium]